MSTFDTLTPGEAVAAARDDAPEYKRITGLKGLAADRIPHYTTQTAAGNTRKPEQPWVAHGHLDKFKEIARVEWAKDADPGTAEVFYADDSTDLIKRGELLCVERPITTADEDEDRTLSELITADGVTLTSQHIATGTDADGWAHHEYRVTIAYDGRTYTQTVLHGIGNKEAPELVETVHMLVSQSMTALAADSYEDWASDFSSDPADWMPEKTYTDNVQMAKDLMMLLGTERYERYAKADHDA
ncbi:hypothetical protein FNV58_01010 (plasmid) [Streptomyces sp. RLB1-9]|uniref:hypothetical protein n=1 Tax=Streptomyces sp. RLB1-9 TaxID=2594454 RepID=UPI0011640BF6|nr:hypothetical protein [Streptomyces sp. RLB1-9]QDN94940.1 hypothetical protein FNV58_01010 [Streptomyces sp. RLB1-9]